MKLSNLMSLPFLLTGVVGIPYNCLNEEEGSYCASANPPGGLSPHETPQFILTTFDDAVSFEAFNYAEKVMSHGHKNPNGSPMPATFFVTTDNTNYHFVQQLHARGSEIAIHTMTHQTNAHTGYDTMRAEIIGCQEALSNLAQIPADDIVGFRAPYLLSSDVSYQVLYDNGFLYDSSRSELIGGASLSNDRQSFIWPYTYDNIDAQLNHVGEAPKRPYPGLWEVPSKSNIQTIFMSQRTCIM